MNTASLTRRFYEEHLAVDWCVDRNTRLHRVYIMSARVCRLMSCEIYYAPSSSLSSWRLSAVR